MIRSFDLETWTSHPGRTTMPIVCGSTATLDKPKGELLTKDQAVKLFQSSEVAAWITANGVYDCACIVAQYPDLLEYVFKLFALGRIKDTHTRQALLDLGRGTFLKAANGAPLERYSLQDCVWKTLGFKIEKENTWRMRYRELDGVPFELWPEDARQYPRDDARHTFDLYVKQGEGSPDDYGIKNLALEDNENRAKWALYLVQTWGMRTDPLMVDSVVAEVTKKHEDRICTYKEHGIIRGADFCKNWKKHGTKPHPCEADTECKPWPKKQINTVDKGWLKTLVTDAYQGTPPRTEKNNISTDHDTLIESGNDTLEDFAHTGKNEKEYSTYLKVIKQGKELPINVEYDGIKKTIRTSSRAPNLQNLPRGGRTRECFVPREEKVLISVDYPSLELVTWGQTLLEMFKESELAKALQRGEDLHVKLAARLEGITYEDGLKLYAAKDSRFKKMRQAAKPVNYGMGGGMGPEKLTLYCRQPSNGGVRFCITLGEKVCGTEKYISKKLKKPLCCKCVDGARMFQDAWHDMIPEARDYFDYISDATHDLENSLIAIDVPEGQPKLWLRGRSFSEAANAKFQGRAAILAKLALSNSVHACYVERNSPLYGSRITAFIHDEELAECPEYEYTAPAYELCRIMENAARYICPDIPCKPKPAAMRRWFKDAETLLDKNGKLTPWWPEKWDWSHDQDIMQQDRARIAK